MKVVCALRAEDYDSECIRREALVTAAYYLGWTDSGMKERLKFDTFDLNYMTSSEIVVIFHHLSSKLRQYNILIEETDDGYQIVDNRKTRDKYDY